MFTSGGIGPTPDDVTYAALARAFGATLQLHEPTCELMREHYERRGVELNEARLRMATLPWRPDGSVEVLFTPDLWVPLVRGLRERVCVSVCSGGQRGGAAASTARPCLPLLQVNLQGVYILPGIPKLFQRMVTAQQDRWRGTTALEVALYCSLGEGECDELYRARVFVRVVVAHACAGRQPPGSRSRPPPRGPLPQATLPLRWATWPPCTRACGWVRTPIRSGAPTGTLGCPTASSCSLSRETQRRWRMRCMQRAS